MVKKEDAKLRQGMDPASPDKPFLDFRRWPLAGATAPEKHLLRIRLQAKAHGVDFSVHRDATTIARGALGACAQAAAA